MAKKLQLGYREIEERLYAFNSSSFWACDIGYQLLYAFGKSERDIERYQEGKGVLSNFNGILIKVENPERTDPSSQCFTDP